MSDEWVEWSGGERPVDADTLVVVRFRRKDQESRGWKTADSFWWHHSATHPNGDIIAYRISPAKEGSP